MRCLPQRPTGARFVLWAMAAVSRRLAAHLRVLETVPARGLRAPTAVRRSVSAPGLRLLLNAVKVQRVLLLSRVRVVMTAAHRSRRPRR